MGQSLFEKVWNAHAVRRLANGQTQLLIGTHLIHEVTSPQAFGMLRDRGLPVKYPERTFATVDHIVPTNEAVEPYSDALAQGMIEELRRNCAEHKIKFFDTNTGKQGIVHIVGPEQGITQPGTTIACGDSHTSTHGAFGAIAFGIGTSQVRDVLATQTIALNKFKVRRINVNGELRPGVYAKDVILHIIRLLGTKGGTGFAYEYGGSTFDNMTMEERMTVCNMSIEGVPGSVMSTRTRRLSHTCRAVPIRRRGRIGKQRLYAGGRWPAMPTATTTMWLRSTPLTSSRR